VPVVATRKLRNISALLMLAEGFTHIGQLWLFKLDSTVVYAALFGVVYLLIALGLAGHSRFTLWIGVVVPALGAYGGYLRYNIFEPELLTLVHISASMLVVAICAYILFRTRHASMD
jgi:hypothetical protein